MAPRFRRRCATDVVNDAVNTPTTNELMADAVSEQVAPGDRLSWRAWWKLIKSALSAWIDDYAPSMGAALSYYTVFSLAPLLVIVISVAGLLFGVEAARGEIFDQLRGIMGADAAKAIEDMLTAFSQPANGITGALIGVGALAIGATTVFGELQDALDRIWRAPVRAGGSGIWHLVRTRLLSFGMILGIAFLLIVSLVLGAVVSALGKWWGVYFGGWDVLARVVDLGVGFVLTTAGFAFIYKFMPRVRVGWSDVWVGAVVTALLFSIGRFLIGFYIGRTGVASGFGAAGAVAVVFVWVYYSAQIFLVGAEFTWVYAQTFGSRRLARSPAEPVVAPSREQAAASAGGAVDSQAPLRAVAPALPAAVPAPRNPAVPMPAVTIGLAAVLVAGGAIAWAMRRSGKA